MSLERGRSRYVGGTPASHHKIAERLTILNKRAPGMLTRLYNLKKQVNEQKNRPAFFQRKDVQPQLQQVSKKFPNVGPSQLSLPAVQQHSDEIVKQLEPYYTTFLDIQKFKEHVYDCLRIIDELYMTLNISINSHLTIGYLNLVANYVKLCLLLSRVEDRKMIVGVYSHAYEVQNNCLEANYVELAEFIQDYFDPIKKLSDEFTRDHQRVLRQAIESCVHVYNEKSAFVEKWQKTEFLSMVATPAKSFLTPSYSHFDMTTCELIPLESLEMWIYFSYLLCYSQFNSSKEITAMWKRVMSMNFTLTLFRSDVIDIIKLAESTLERAKEAKKLIKEMESSAIKRCAATHRERRRYLVHVLKEACIVFKDQPGLLGPRALNIFQLLSTSRDEVVWSIRHFPRDNQNKKTPEEEFKDRQLAEIVFYIEDLRTLVMTHQKIIQKYYCSLMHQFNAPALNEHLKSFSVSPEEEAEICSSFVQIMSQLSPTPIDENKIPDLRGFRLDWFRLQSYTSVARPNMNLMEMDKFAKFMNNNHFHSELIDDLPNLLEYTSNLSLFCWYQELFQKTFMDSVKTRNRFCIGLVSICGHFANERHQLCPEEFQILKKYSIEPAKKFLTEMANEAKRLMVLLYNQRALQSDNLLPFMTARNTDNETPKKKRNRRKEERVVSPDRNQPGAESRRRDRTLVTEVDKIGGAIQEMALSFTHFQTITIWNHVFTPKEFFFERLERAFPMIIVKLVNAEPKECTIEKPSMMLNKLHGFIDVMQSVGTLVDIDVRTIISTVLLEQTQASNSAGEKTMTAYYSSWYREVLLRQATEPRNDVIFSPNKESFSHFDPLNDAANKGSPQDYTNPQELRALAELLGPYGIRFIIDGLSIQISSQIKEILQLVRQNRNSLRILRTSFENHTKMNEFTHQLSEVQVFLNRLQVIGVIIEFQHSLERALEYVLEHRVPYLLAPIREMHSDLGKFQDLETQFRLVELGRAAGLISDFDVTLCRHLLQNVPNDLSKRFEEYENCCLLLVFAAVTIPFLAKDGDSEYSPNLGGHRNNTHCIAKAINLVATALFIVNPKGPEVNREDEIGARMVEFLALASSSLLRIGHETGIVSRNREAVYLLLGDIVKKSKHLTMDKLETCFPYVLLRYSYASIQDKIRRNA